jgi:adenine-specific DNA-methyltransferase
MINYELPNESTIRFNYSDNDGRKWAAYSLMSAGSHKGLDYTVKTPSGKVVKPHKGMHWRCLEDSLQQLIKEDRIWFGQHGDSIPRLKKYLDETHHKKPKQ